MQNLQILNSNFIIYTDENLTIDVLGGVNLQQIERLVCTLRITHLNYSPFRSTLDLYNDHQFDKLLRTLCEKFELKLLDVSKSLHALILQLEQYRLENLKYTDKSHSRKFDMNQGERLNAIKRLKHKNLLQLLSNDLQTIGIIGEQDKAVILFLSLASYKYTNPFSVLCLAKSGTGKSYILQKLSECMPNGSYSFHTQITENALYYFNSEELQNKALFIEDLEWTHQMLNPLATLQSQGKLIKTRTTKDKDGMLHSTTFEVTANLCLVACAYSDRNYEELSLPFLCLHLNQSTEQDYNIMEYQKKCKAGLIQQEEIKKIQHNLKCLIASLDNVSIINPYATLINLPDNIAYPRKSLLLLLNFIDIITYFFQHQRERIVNKNTGEIFIKTHPEDIETAFKYLKPYMFRRADELSTATRSFYNWLGDYLKQAKTNKFTALDIRKAKHTHPRTLNRYLHELKLFSYIQVTGGNKYREGFIYKLTNFGDQTDIQSRIEVDINNTIQAVWSMYEKETKPVGQSELANLQTQPA